MQRKTLKRLAMAIMAASLLVGVGERAIGLEVSASTFVSNLGGYVANGDVHAAIAALKQLQAMGIKRLRVGTADMMIDQLVQELSNPVASKSMLGALVEALKAGGSAYFVAENRIISSVNWGAAQHDAFPTGSAG